jgi:hypothetical protein
MPLSRRHFLTLTAMTGTQVLFNSLDAFAKPLAGTAAHPAYDLFVFATKWGDTGSWNDFASKVKQAGYDGAEFGPVDYMPALPYTRQPLADQWQINKHMVDTLRTRYS